VDDPSRQRLDRVWNQNAAPVILRRGPGNPLRMRLPYRSLNRAWLQGDGRRNPAWKQQGKFWELPQAWFDRLVDQCLSDFGKVYVIQPHRAQEKCAPACWDAAGHECQCSCLGANHGVGSPSGRWKIVSEAFAARWGQREVACRLIERKSDLLSRIIS
jgi:hypothetical protein